MAYYYRYTDVSTNPNDVKDMQLSTSYGDLSDGTSKVIKMNPGIVDSNIGLFQFPIANSYKFGAPGQITGFNFRFKTLADDSDDIANLQSTKTFGDYSIYLHKKGAAFEGGVEGDVQQLGENVAYTMNAQMTQNPNDKWVPMDLMAYLTSMDYAYPEYQGFYEDFEGTSDVDTTVEVTQGAVRKKGDPYITLDVAHDSVARQAAGARLSKMELDVFYGSNFKGARIIKLKNNGKTWGPLTKRGEGGMGPAWQSQGIGTGGSNKAGTTGSTAYAAQVAIAEGGGVGGGETVYKQKPTGYKKITDVFSGRTTSAPTNAHNLKASPYMKTFDKYTGGIFRTTSGKTGTVAGGKLGNVTTAAKAGGKKIPVVGAVLSAGLTLWDVHKRDTALEGAVGGGDASGLARPLRDPVWYSKASWKNMHVGEKGIAGSIKYSYETILNPLEQKDAQAITTTSTWWDQVRERTDYPKSEVRTDGLEISYVGNETMAAKTSINFHTGDSISGQSMEMRAYADYDANQLPRNQEAFSYGTPSGAEQQDIFVSKRLPCPKTMFCATSGGSGASNVGLHPEISDTGNRWELTLDLKIANGWTPYAMAYHGATNYRPSLRRTMAITFGTLKPEDNDDLQSYIKRHTDGAGTFTAGQKITGVYFMPTMDYGTGAADQIHINPISTYKWTGAGDSIGVGNETTLAYGEGSWDNDMLHQSSLTNGSYGCKFPTGKFVRMKFATTPLGASGIIPNDDGSTTTEQGNEAKHQGRFWLTLHDPESDDVLPPTADDSGDYGFGTTKKGPMVLTAPNDPVNALDNQAGSYRYAHNLGYHDGRSADGAGLGDGHPGDHSIWTPYFTIWVCNHRWNSTGSNSYEIAKKGSDNTTANNVYKHDVFQKAIIKSDQSVDLHSLVPDTQYKNPNFSDMRLLVDQIALKGVEPDVVNMSVNNENKTSGQLNMLNRANSKFPKYYNGVNSDFYQDALGTSSFSTDQAEIKTLTNLPTVLSLGFTKAGGENWISNAVDEGSGNYGASSTSKPSFLLLNDFISQKQMPTAIPDANLAAMYTSADEKTRLCGDPIDLLGKLGSSASKNPFHASGTVGNLSIGNTAGNHIVTGNAETDVWDRNRSTSHKMYANNFQNKGFLQFQKDMMDASTYTNKEKGWFRRENVYASTHILKATDVTAKKATLTVSQADVLYRNTVIDEDVDTGHDLFILYQYGRPLSFATDQSLVNGENMGTCAIGTIERDENQITFTKVTSHSTMTGNDDWQGYTALHDGVGGDLSVILRDDNLPRCMISPYRRWLCINIGMGPNGGTEAIQETLDEIPPRGYGSITPVKRPRVAGTDATYGGFAMGPTFNESRWYVNSSDQNPYYAKSSYDLQEGNTAYHTDLDFGFGAYDMTTGMGGQVGSFRPDYNRNTIDLSKLLVGASDLANSEGKPLSFVISAASTGEAETNALYIHSSQTTNAQDRPKLVTEFFDEMPPNPGMVVNINEENPHHPQFDFAIGGDDIWHSFLMVDDKPITGKFHNMIAYAPLNENLDTWTANVTYDTDITPKQIKVYNHEDFIGKERIGSTYSASDIQTKMSYATSTGLAGGNIVWAYTNDTCEGLSGHAKLGGGEFYLGLYPAVTDAGYVPNTKTDYRKHFTAQGIFTFNSSMSTNNYSMMGHGSDTSPSWVLYYDGTNKQVVARAYYSGTGYVELKSTTAPLLDDTTPMHVAIVLDTELLESNFKLYINGVLEDQTGKSLATGSTNNWDYGEVLYDANNSTWVIGNAMGTIPEGSLATIEWTGKIEECIVHKCPLYFFPNGTDSFIYTKELEEVTDSISGEVKSYHARLFTMDYHNIRYPVANSNNQSWKIPSFNIDGR